MGAQASAGASQVSAAEHGRPRAQVGGGDNGSAAASTGASAPIAGQSTSSSPASVRVPLGSEPPPSPSAPIERSHSKANPQVWPDGLSQYLLAMDQFKQSKRRGTPIQKPSPPHGYMLKETPFKVPVWVHQDTGIQVWGIPINLCESADDEPVVLYRYTEKARFMELTKNSVPDEANVLLTMEVSQTLEFGKGSYLCFQEPAAGLSKETFVLNKFWPKPGDQTQAEQRLLLGPNAPENEDVRKDILATKGQRADYGLAVMCSRRMVYNIWDRPAPGMPLENWRPGTNIQGELQWAGRDIWVLALEKEQQIRLALRCQGLLTSGDRLKDKTLACFDNLAIMLEESAQNSSLRPERLRQAEEIHREVLAARSHALGFNHPETAQSMNNLSVLLCHMGKFEEAEVMARRAIKVFKKDMDWESSRMMHCRNNLACMRERSNMAGAQLVAFNQHQTILIDRRDEIKAKSDVKQQSVCNLMLAADSAGQVGLLEELSQTFKTNVQDPTTGPGFSCRDMAARLMWLRGDLGEAMDAYCSILLGQGAKDSKEAARSPSESRVAGRIGTLGSKHVDTLGALENLASVLCEAGQYDEADALLHRAVHGYYEVLGKHHPAVRHCLANLALVLSSRGDLDAAEDYFHVALEDRLSLTLELAGPIIDYPDIEHCLVDQIQEPLTEKIHDLMYDLCPDERFHVSMDSGVHDVPMRPVISDTDSQQNIDQGGDEHGQSGLLTEIMLHLPYRCSRQNSLARLAERTKEQKEDICRIASHVIQETFDGVEPVSCSLLTMRLWPSLQGPLDLAHPANLHPDVLAILSNFSTLLRRLGSRQRYSSEGGLSHNSEVGPSAGGSPVADAGRRSPPLVDSAGQATLSPGDATKQSKYHDAHQLCKFVMEMRKRAMGEESPEYLESLNNHALILHDMGEVELATDACREALAGRALLFESGHPCVMQSKINLAIMLQAKAEGQEDEYHQLLSEAWDLYCNVLGHRLEKLGCSHPDTLRALECVKALERRSNEHDQRHAAAGSGKRPGLRRASAEAGKRPLEDDVSPQSEADEERAAGGDRSTVFKDLVDKYNDKSALSQSNKIVMSLVATEGLQPEACDVNIGECIYCICRVSGAPEVGFRRIAPKSQGSWEVVLDAPELSESDILEFVVFATIKSLEDDHEMDDLVGRFDLPRSQLDAVADAGVRRELKLQHISLSRAIDIEVSVVWATAEAGAALERRPVDKPVQTFDAFSDCAPSNDELAFDTGGDRQTFGLRISNWLRGASTARDQQDVTV